MAWTLLIRHNDVNVFPQASHSVSEQNVRVAQWSVYFSARTGARRFKTQPATHVLLVGYHIPSKISPSNQRFEAHHIKRIARTSKH